MKSFMRRYETQGEIILFMILTGVIAIGNGFSDSIYANYFKEAYDVTAAVRGFIEFPRELPGLLCALIIAALSVLGDLKTALLAQIASVIGLLVLGLFTPTFGVMLLFLFLSSMGLHLYMPLQESIGMSLAEPHKVGYRMGQFASIRSMFGFVAGIVVFLGFRYGFFSFQTPVKWVFLYASIAFICASILLCILIRKVKGTSNEVTKRSMKPVFRKEYKYYYFLTTLQGVQKQIAYVYGSWVIIDLLKKGADTMALLLIVSSLVGIFFLRYLGKWLDNYGIRTMMFADAVSFIVIYVIYGCIVWAINTGNLPSTGLSIIFIYILFILDRLSMQMGMVKSVYLKSIAVVPEEVTPTLSTGISLDHLVSIIAAYISGLIWMHYGSHYVFFIAAAFSLGNLYVAFHIKDNKMKIITDKSQ